ncbi:MAG: DUF3830 family protein [Candidatus Bipolaricaulis sp.]|nr:DUF3830 family protein [Candidatus Bipolaricaulis sp.]MDD5220413.1 DUF3830 family protein [Candidatus Bipolaricaulis sp.]MDD5646389.1 DUF3830 family protein [Candidatus Bipolaricaulis sp.]
MTGERLRLEFERGGVLIANVLSDEAPQTIAAVLSALPIETTAYHTRWCGREVYFPVTLGRSGPPRENDTSTVNAGDVIYWREWEKSDGASEALSVYYGAEVVRDHRGFLPVNVFARVTQDQWPKIAEIGVRIWQHGVERIRVARIDRDDEPHSADRIAKERKT